MRPAIPACRSPSRHPGSPATRLHCFFEKGHLFVKQAAAWLSSCMSRCSHLFAAVTRLRGPRRSHRCKLAFRPSSGVSANITQESGCVCLRFKARAQRVRGSSYAVCVLSCRGSVSLLSPLVSQHKTSPLTELQDNMGVTGTRHRFIQVVADLQSDSAVFLMHRLQLVAPVICLFFMAVNPLITVKPR